MTDAGAILLYMGAIVILAFVVKHNTNVFNKSDNFGSALIGISAAIGIMFCMMGILHLAN